MFTLPRTLVVVMATLLLTPWGTPAAAAHPLNIEDLLQMQVFVGGQVDPKGRWLILEIEAPYKQSASFESFWLTRTGRSRLYQVDLKHLGPPRLAFAQPPGAYLFGSFSPSGRYALVHRERDFKREAGILTLADGRIHWLGVGAEFNTFGATTIWRKDDHLLILALDVADRPFQDRATVAGKLDIPKWWRRALLGLGETAVTNGSGRFLGTHPREPDRRLLDIDSASGARRELAKGAFAGMALSPGEDRLALISEGERVAPPISEMERTGFAPHRRNLTLLDMTSLHMWSPTPGVNIIPKTLRWSGDGALLFAGGPQDSSFTEPTVYRLPARAEDATPISLEDSASNGFLKVATPGVHLNWMGEDPIVYAASSGRDGWYRLTPDGPINLTVGLNHPHSTLEALSADGLLIVDDDGLHQINPAGHNEQLMSAPSAKAVEPIDSYNVPPNPLDAPEHSLAATVFSEGKKRALTTLALDGRRGSIALPPAEMGDQSSSIAAVGGGGALLVTLKRHGATEVTWVKSDSASVPLMRLNAQLDVVDWSHPEVIEHRGPKGELLRDWLYLPPNQKSGDKFPLVVLGYPTAVWTNEPRGGRPGAEQLDDNEQLLAAQGFAVLAPSLPRLGEDFIEGMTPQVLDAISRVSGRPGIDAERIGYWGHSGGALLGFKLATETSRFSAIVAAAGTSDLISVRGEPRPSSKIGPDWDEALHYQMAWTEDGQGGLHATPYTDLAHYIRSSPILAADRITTPLLIVHGDEDGAPYAQSLEMFSALYRLNKDALFLTFLGEDHCVGSPPNMRRYISTVTAFFKQELKAKP